MQTKRSIGRLDLRKVNGSGSLIPTVRHRYANHQSILNIASDTLWHGCVEYPTYEMLP